MITIENITVLNDIQERLKEITEAEIAGAARRMSPPKENEKTLGKITQPSTRALYALWQKLFYDSAHEQLLAHTVPDVEVEADHSQRSVIAASLGDVVKELFWAQAKSDLGLWKATSVGIRHGWTIVEASTDKNPLAGLSARLSGE